MLVYLIVAACFVAALALTLAAVVLSSRLSQDNFEEVWLPEERPAVDPAVPDPDQSTA